MSVTCGFYAAPRCHVWPHGALADGDGAAAARFALKVQESEEVELAPIFTEEGVTYVYVKVLIAVAVGTFPSDGQADACTQHGALFLMGMTKRNSNVTLALLFLHQLIQVRVCFAVMYGALTLMAAACRAQVFSEYCGELHEESIRDNFVILYELLDEMMDFGYPQITDHKILKLCVCARSRCCAAMPRAAHEARHARAWLQVHYAGGQSHGEAGSAAGHRDAGGVLAQRGHSAQEE